MKPFVIRPVSSLKGGISLPGDKSIAHRCIILGSLSNAVTTLENFPLNKDCLYTLNAFKKLGVNIKKEELFGICARVRLYGRGLLGLKKPADEIFAGESGTTMRLLLGVLAGQDFETRLSAASSLSKRPMRRVTEPLRMMGAVIKSRVKSRDSQTEEFAPMVIKGAKLKAVSYKMPIASAQVKSAILLAALFARGKTRVVEPLKSRDHTERMLKLFKADIKTKGSMIEVSGERELTSPGNIYIPGDISSAAFFIVAAAILPGSGITIKRVSLNPSRMGVISVLKRMGADILTTYDLRLTTVHEPTGDIIVKASPLKGVVVKKKEIPYLIDELPILMVAASLAGGRTVFEGVAELRVKETDRISSMSDNLAKMGVEISVSKSKKREDIIIKGVKRLKGARVKSFGDHRSAMSMIVAGLAASGSTRIDDVSCIDKSFPDFLNILKLLTKHTSLRANKNSRVHSG